MQQVGKREVVRGGVVGWWVVARGPARVEEERRGVWRVARAKEGRGAVRDVGSEAWLRYGGVDGDLHFKID